MLLSTQYYYPIENYRMLKKGAIGHYRGLSAVLLEVLVEKNNCTILLVGYVFKSKIEKIKQLLTTT